MWFNKQLFEKGFLIGLKGKKLATVITLISLFPLIGAMAPHPYHVSYTEIEYKKEVKTLTFSIEIFTDDLEAAIKLNYKPEKFFLGADSISQINELLIQQYVKNKVTVLIDGVVLKSYSFLPSESNPDRTLVYFQFTDLPPFDGLTFYSEILTHLYKDQQNIVEYKRGQRIDKALLNNDKTNETWKNK
jgi:hypothetical protein